MTRCDVPLAPGTSPHIVPHPTIVGSVAIIIGPPGLRALTVTPAGDAQVEVWDALMASYDGQSYTTPCNYTGLSLRSLSLGLLVTRPLWLSFNSFIPMSPWHPLSISAVKSHLT